MLTVVVEGGGEGGGGIDAWFSQPLLLIPTCEINVNTSITTRMFILAQDNTSTRQHMQAQCLGNSDYHRVAEAMPNLVLVLISRQFPLVKNKHNTSERKQKRMHKKKEHVVFTLCLIHLFAH